MKIILYIIIACCLNSGGLYSQEDSVLSGDTLKVKKIITHSADSEVVIEFDKSKLAPDNVRLVFNELFKQYISVKDALVYNDSYNAMRNTLKLLDYMKSKTKGIDILNKDDRWILFLNNYESIRNKIESAKFISDQRFLFSEITNGIQIFIKHYGLYDKTIYIMHCYNESPAVNALWFSDSRDRKNPYLGKLNDTTCAKVKEVWKFR